MLAGGPIVYVSKKLNHVGHNAFHNEYMAMSECSKAIVWLRQLLVEINKSELIPNPTILYGDNNAAVNLTYENFTSSGNQYIYLAYHYIKEVIKGKEVVNKTTIITTNSVYGIKEDQYVNIVFNDGLTDNKHDEKYKILNIDITNKKITINGIIPEELFENNNKVFWCHAKDDISPNELFK